MQHLDEVLALRTDPEAVPAVLMPLATMAPTDTLAARTLLQALLPGLLTLAATVSPGDAAAVEEMLSLAWERIRTYPSQRNGPVAGNVLLDVRKWYFEHRAIEAPPRPLWQLMETDEARVVPTPEDEVVGRMSFCDLMTAHRRAVGERCHRAIVRVDVEGFSLAEVAAEEGVDAHLVYQRRYDGRARIRRQPRSRTDAERKRVRTRDRFRLAHLAEGNAKQARKRVAANILLRDASGRVLLVNPNYKPYWDLPGGMAEANEPPRHAASRELREELGLTVPIGRLLTIDWVAPNDPWDDQLVFVFDGGELDEADAAGLKVQDPELCDCAVVPFDDAQAMLRPDVARRLRAAQLAKHDGTIAYDEVDRTW